MAIQVRKGGAWNELSGIKVRSGRSWRSIKAVKVFSGGAWRTVATYATTGGGGGGGGGGSGGGSSGGGSTSDPMTLSAAPATAFKSGTASSQTYSSVTATPANGNTPITYAWSKVSQTAGPTFAINYPTLASTSVTASSLPDNGSEYAVTLKCVATDSVGRTATSNNVTITFSRASLSPE